MTKTYIGIHGGWGNSLEPLTHQLHFRGYNAYAPTLLGCAPDENRTEVTLEKMAHQITNFILDKDIKSATLYCHSGGGAVAILVAGQLPEIVQQVIFISAAIPYTGECLLDLWGDQYQMLREMGESRPDKSVPMDRDLWRTVFTNNSPDILWEEEFAPLACPVRWLTDTPNYDKFWESYLEGSLSASYIFLNNDQAAPDVFPKMAARLKNSHLFHTKTMGGHMAVLLDPEYIADTLEEASVRMEEK